MRCSVQFDLGRDKSHIKDPRDAHRQHATVDELLRRMFDKNATRRKEVQILADEVGMGKTFVALGVAYSVLAHMRENAPDSDDDLSGCYKKVLIITPQNSALFSKWEREAAEFVRRCVLPQFQKSASKEFEPQRVDRFDELMKSVSTRGTGASIFITHMGVLAGGKFRHYDLKRRFILGALFRYWGNSFRVDRRERLLKGAPDDWPHNPYELEYYTTEEWSKLPFDETREAIDLLAKVAAGDEGQLLVKLLELCREISEPYVRNRDQEFKGVESLLNKLYRVLVAELLKKAFPLVIVDEAHNWKNGPLQGANGFDTFKKLFAPKARRALLLTATPFQLRPEEILELLKVSDHIQPSQKVAISASRRECLKKLREEVIRPVLKNSENASRRFSKAWSSTSREVDPSIIESAWHSPGLVTARQELAAVALRDGVIEPEIMHSIADPLLQPFDPTYRKLLREALYLYAYNADLSKELGAFVIRHRRRTDHRLFRIGDEYGKPSTKVAARQDRHVVHAAPGLDVRGDGELPHYLLMRCVTEMKKGKGRSSLGSALTGCYSTLIESAEGKSVREKLGDAGMGRVYLDLLMEMIDAKEDEKHPKVRAVAEEVLRAWKHGEKSLIFCFRVNTARRLREIIDQSIRAELDKKRRNCLGSESALRALRSRLTGRDRDLSPLAMDRVLWSFCHAYQSNESDRPPFEPQDLVLRDDELFDLSRLALLFREDFSGDRIDRVFLHRCTEHIVAKRIMLKGTPSRFWKKVLSQLSDLDWIRGPYGWKSATADESGGEEEASYDERGLHSRYEDLSEPDKSAVQELGDDLIQRRQRRERADRISIFDTYAYGPNLWLGDRPGESSKEILGTLNETHRHLLKLTTNTDELDWHTRMMVMQSLRRALLRESMLLRLLPEREEREEASWGELLVQSFYSPLPYQHESMADRITVFLEDMEAASGSIANIGTQRHVMYESTRLRDQQFVALVSGETDAATKDRVFTGFNTPLLPEVLVCTSVGQEGVDLHRHCRHVIHYDLAWNPAVIEQRTGRTDRIGSKTFRERAVARNGSPPFLDIGLPFLAGTYDERMFEELRIRAQTFEVLTGGDLAKDNLEGIDDTADAEGSDRCLDYLALPRQMVNDLRVELEVWKAPSIVASTP